MTDPTKLRELALAVPDGLTFGDPQDENNVQVFWTNPWDGSREAIASLFWPGHPIEETANIEAQFEALGKLIVTARPSILALLEERTRLREAANFALEGLEFGHDEDDCGICKTSPQHCGPAKAIEMLRRALTPPTDRKSDAA